MSRLTVIQTLPALNTGGVERGTVEVAAELVRRGHRSIVVSAGGELLDELKSCGSEHIELPIAAQIQHLFSMRDPACQHGSVIWHGKGWPRLYGLVLSPVCMARTV